MNDVITYHASASGGTDYLDFHTPDEARYYAPRGELRALLQKLLANVGDDVACPDCGRLNGVHSINPGGWLCPAALAPLTADDPEPAPGTTVEMESGQRWTRYPDMWPGSWLVEGGEADSDPETWLKIAGNYGPVRIVRLP